MSETGGAVRGRGPHAEQSVRLEPLLPGRRRWSRLATLRDAADLSSAVYGSLLATALVVVEMQSDASAEVVGLSVGAAVTVFWLAHVWAALVNLRLRARVTGRDVLECAWAELPMLLAAVPPVLALAAGRAVGLTVGQAEAVALAVAVTELFLWGLAVGRTSARGWRGATVVAAVDVGLGLAIVSLKAVVVH